MSQRLSHEYSARQAFEKRYHDEKYRDEAEGQPCAASNIKRAFTKFWDVMSEANGLTILDFGCGDGWLTVALATRGNYVHGFDISEVLVKRARQRAEASGVADRVSVKEMAGEDADYAADMFDMVVGSAVLHHTDLDVALPNIRRILKPSGTAVFLEPLNHNPILALWRRLTPSRRSATERAFSSDDLAAVRKFFPSVRMTFFSLTSIVTVGLLLLVPKSRVVHFINDRLDEVDDWLLGRFPALGRFSAVVLLEMRK